MKKTLVLLVLGFALASCNAVKQTENKNLVIISGKLEKLGMTTFQYGTHILTVDARTYALKSDKIDLDKFTDQKVTIKGSKVKGYPIENGPELIDVEAVTSK